MVSRQPDDREASRLPTEVQDRNRIRIGQGWGNLIHAIAAGTIDSAIRAEVEEALPEIEAGGGKIENAT